MKNTNHPRNSPDSSQVASGQGHNQSQSLTVSERTSLTLSVVALALAGIAIGVLIMMPMLIDAKVQAGIAHAETEAHNARTAALVAQDKVGEIRVQLAAKGIVTVIN